MRYYPSQWGKRYHFDNIYQPLLELSMVRLYQAGEIIAGDGYEISEHTQFCSEISYIVSGECEIYSDGQVLHARQGDIHVVSPGKKHRIVAQKEENFRMAYIGFHVRPELAQQPIGVFFEAAPSVLKQENRQLRGLFEQLLEEIYIFREYGDSVVDACITQILICVWRAFHLPEYGMNQRISDDVRVERIVGHTVFKVLRYIDANLLEIENVEQVAQELRYNPSYLSKVFREKVGCTMRQYITDKKIEMAKELLASGVSVSQTALKMGYSSSQSFCKMFHRCTGQIPSDVLRTGKNGNTEE